MSRLLIRIEKIIIRLIACFENSADTLNLTIEGNNMALSIGLTATAKIAPTAAGAPATVTNVVYACVPAGAYTIVPAADNMSAVYTAAVVGTGNEATVQAVNSAGTVLTDAAALPDVTAAAGPPADALNLSVSIP
jgi:hypothetical protein